MLTVTGVTFVSSVSGMGVTKTYTAEGFQWGIECYAGIAIGLSIFVFTTVGQKNNSMNEVADVWILSTLPRQIRRGEDPL